MEGAHRRRQLTAGLLAAVAAAATDWGYLAIIHSQNALPPLPRVVPFITGYIAAIAAASVVAIACVLGGRPAAAKTVFLSAAAGSAALGCIGIFSIGLALLITAALLSIAAAAIPPFRRPYAWVWPVSGAAVSIAALIVGFVAVGTF
jgi:hypothetical protein